MSETIAEIRARHEAWPVDAMGGPLTPFGEACADRATLLLALAEAQERAERAEAALKAAQEPDMFWDQENPETPYWDIEELLREREYDRDTDVVIETSEAIRCGDSAYLCRIISAAEDADDDSPTFCIRKLTEDERKEYRNIERIWYAIRQLKPLFAARAAQTLKERTDV